MSFEQENEIQNTAAEGMQSADAVVSVPSVGETEPTASSVSSASEEPSARKEAPTVSSGNMVALAVRSAFWTVTAVVLVFACFLSFFPYSAMRFYTKLDRKDMALHSAEKYLARHADAYNEEKNILPSAFGKYADALYVAVNNSIDLMNENVRAKGYDSSAALYYARKADKYVTMYLRANTIGSLYERTQRIDSYNLTYSQPALHPYVYSYADSLEATRFKVWYMLDKQSEMVSRINLATTGWNESSGEWTPTETELRAAMVFFSQLSAYIEGELNRIAPSFRYELQETVNGQTTTRIVDMDEALAQVGLLDTNRIRIDMYEYKPFSLFVQSNGTFTALYNDVTYRFDTFVSALRDHSITYAPGTGTADAAKHLQYTYYLKIYKDFALNMANMTAVLSAGRGFYAPTGDAVNTALQRSATEYESKYNVRNVRVTRDGVTQTGTYNMGNWYNWGMLYDYLGFWRAVNP